MVNNSTLQHKVLSLMLHESGLAVDNSELDRLSEDTDIKTALDIVLERLSAAAELAKPEVRDNSSSENDAESASEVTSSAAEPASDVAPAAPIMDPELEADIVPALTASDDAAHTVNSSPEMPAEMSSNNQDDWQPATFPELAASAPASPLKPGEVPTASQKPPVSAPRPPQARINIANARVGAPFHSEIDIVLDNGASARIEQVQFSQQVGLTFDATSAALSGIPSQSGDIPLTVTWSCAEFSHVISQAMLIINPDPRSLWKVIDPPANDRYFKKSVESRQIRTADSLIVAASRRGRSHEHVGSFRDDDFYIASNAETSWNIMLVADGAGSAKNSREGSRIVTQTVGEYFKTQLASEKGRELKQRIAAWTPDDQRLVGESFIRLFHQASVMAINNVKNASINIDEPVKSFATTLLACISFRAGNEQFAAAFWMGDGAIAAYGPAGKVRVLGTPDSGEYAGQTRFLDADAVQDAEFSKRVSIGKWSDVSHLILMTDGVSDPRFETDNGLLQAAKWDALLNDLTECLHDDAHSAERMAEWLNFFSPGNHDDRTLIVSRCLNSSPAAE